MRKKILALGLTTAVVTAGFTMAAPSAWAEPNEFHITVGAESKQEALAIARLTIDEMSSSDVGPCRELGYSFKTTGGGRRAGEGWHRLEVVIECGDLDEEIEDFVTDRWIQQLGERVAAAEGKSAAAVEGYSSDDEGYSAAADDLYS